MPTLNTRNYFTSHAYGVRRLKSTAPQCFHDYLTKYPKPTIVHPLSHFTPTRTQKFAEYVRKRDPALFQELAFQPQIPTKPQKPLEPRIKLTLDQILAKPVSIVFTSTFIHVNDMPIKRLDYFNLLAADLQNYTSLNRAILAAAYVVAYEDNHKEKILLDF